MREPAGLQIYHARPPHSTLTHSNTHSIQLHEVAPTTPLPPPSPQPLTTFPDLTSATTLLSHQAKEAKETLPNH